MAKIEQEFLAREHPTERAFQARPFMPRGPAHDLGLARIDGARFYTPEFMQQEWDSIWTKTWQIACRTAELATPGSYFVHETPPETMHPRFLSADAAIAHYQRPQTAEVVFSLCRL